MLAAPSDLSIFKPRWLVCLSVLLLAPTGVTAGSVSVAVASNFANTARELVAEFERSSGFEATLSSASTGKLYAQIVHGAPFDVFLAADAERPGRLESAGLIVPASRRTYALGSLWLWSREPAVGEADCLRVLATPDGRRIAIANPRHAPYGVAAREYLERAQLWDALGDRLAYGENVAQALQFAASGAARAAIVSAALLQGGSLPAAGCVVALPRDGYAPIVQQLVRARARDWPRGRPR